MFGQRTSLTMAGSRVGRQTGSGESERSVSELQMKANDNEGLSPANEHLDLKRPKTADTLPSFKFVLFKGNRRGDSETS